MSSKKSEERGKKILDVNITRGVAGPSHKWKGMEDKIRKAEREKDQLKEEVKRYQEKLGRKEKERRVVDEELERYQAMKRYQGNLGSSSAGEAGATIEMEKEEEDRRRENEEEMPQESQQIEENTAQGKNKETEQGPGANGKSESRKKEQPKDSQKIEEARERNAAADSRKVEGKNQPGAEAENKDGDTADEIEQRTNEELRRLRSTEQQEGNMGRNRGPNNSDGEKDNSKLCNRFVLNGKCYREGKGCRYTHKRLCKDMINNG